nr:MAG TPA: hypothetical protein [Caudoviricetes sp.]DAZ30920.1 MAG TPA: hypothetical protein [Caudoviricetes sp.]
MGAKCPLHRKYILRRIFRPYRENCAETSGG